MEITLNIIKYTNIRIKGIPKKKEQGTENLFDEMTKFP